MQRIFIFFYLFLGLALSTRGLAEEKPSRSKITDIGRVITATHETRLLTVVNGFEKRTQVAIKIYTTFRLHQNYDVKIIFSKEGLDDNTITLVVQTGMTSLLTGDYEKDSPHFKDDLFADRSANLNREGLLPDYMLSEIKRRMVSAYYESKAKDNSTQLYESLHAGVTILSALIYNPVVIKGSLIPESLWNSDYAFVNPEAAGFVDGAYNTLKALPELPHAITQATDLARELAFNYTLNTDGYRDATNELVVEMATDLDTYIRLAEAIESGKQKLNNIYHGTTKEDRYYRGIIAFEVVALLIPLAETKVAVKTASGMRKLLAELKALKLGKGKETKVLLSSFKESVSEWRFGKNNWTWDEYYKNLNTKYPADYDKVIDVVVKNSSNGLTHDEAYSIFSMTTIFHQVKLNNLLREGQLTEKVLSTTKLLDKALNKMAKVPANKKYYRGIDLEGDELAKFLKKHQQNSIVEYPEYIFTANNRKDAFIDSPLKNIKISILTKENSKGRVIHDVSYGKISLGTTDEAMFMRDSKFEVKSYIDKGNNIYEIELIEK